jgi:hypothetical protein
MSDILNKATVLLLNRNWQAVGVRTPADAFCQMATNAATALDIEVRDSASPAGPRAEALRPVKWDEWITLPIRESDAFVNTMRGPIRVPTVIVAVNYARVPMRRPNLNARAIRERDGNRLPQEAGLKLLSTPRAPKELPVTALIRNAHGIAEWKLFLNE